MWVLHVDTRPDWRGGEAQVLLTMKGLRERGWGVELLALEGGALGKRAEEEKFVVHAIPKSMVRVRGAKKLRELLEAKKLNIVQVHDPHALSVAWMARAHKQTILLSHRRVANRLTQSAIGLARYRAARRVVAISKYVAQSVLLSGISKDKIEIIYEGVEIPPATTAETHAASRKHLKLPAHGPLLGCVGYLLPEKGQEVLIRAMPAVLTAHPECRLVLAGDGPCRQSLEALARELEVAEAIVFLGFVENIAEVYRALDVFVFPSLAEPLGTSLLAAMAYGLPVIGVRSGGVPEIVKDGHDGLLVQEPEAKKYAKAINTLLSDSGKAKQLGEAARETAQKRFSADVMVQNTEELYKRLLEERD
jgi:glycosyltransferase involved in cell wall biosynthesis